MSNGVKTILELENVTMQFGGVVAVAASNSSMAATMPEEPIDQV